MILIVMGVSGSGKSTLGRALALKLGFPFIEGDDFHSPGNINKMARGEPLTDRDRKPWLEALHHEISGKTDCVLACSALKESYRKILAGGKTDGLLWILLTGDKQILLERLKTRSGHFMPPSLLESQFAALEEPPEALKLPVEIPLEEKISRVLKTLGERS